MEKISVLFVCLGNICRSPAAEAIFIQLLNNDKRQNEFIVDSAGTGSWHVGKGADPRMRLAAKQRGIIIKSKARQINIDDLKKFNYIIAMDNSNYKNIMKIKNRESQCNYSKILKIQEYASVFHEKEVPDPYFGGDDGFNYVLDILEDSVNGFLKSIS